jgi:glycosyltransferase involved in cell wall biosynthesis
MLKVAQMPEDGRQAMAAAARRRVEEKFSESVVIRAYLDAVGKIGSSRS